MNASEVVALWILPTTLLNNGTFAIPAVNCLRTGVRFRQANFFIELGATDIALTTVKLTESDDNITFTDIAGTVFGGAGNPALPIATDDNTAFDISVVQKKQYLKLVISVGAGVTGATATVVCILDQPQAAALSDILAAARGMAGHEVVLTS